jgi:hypothetical protein
MAHEGYFEAGYIESRQKVVEELREMAEKGPPAPEANWDVIWVFSGPELNFDGDMNTRETGRKIDNYNQTKQRWETALTVARQVTAVRLGKPVEQITRKNIAEHGPAVYFNGTQKHNECFRKYCESGGLVENEYDFPSSKIQITKQDGIVNTGDQFQDFPAELVPETGRLVLVSDLYHLPRVKRYAKKNEAKMPLDRLILYPAQPQKLPIRNTIEGIRSIYPYLKKGFIKE